MSAMKYIPKLRFCHHANYHINHIFALIQLSIVTLHKKTKNTKLKFLCLPFAAFGIQCLCGFWVTNWCRPNVEFDTKTFKKTF